MAIRKTTQVEPRLDDRETDSPLLLAKVRGELVACYAFRYWHEDPLSWRYYGRDGLAIDAADIEWWAYASQVQDMIEEANE